MKVLYITDPVIDGGATRSLIDVVSSMKEKKVECTVCVAQEGKLTDELSEIGIDYVVTGHMAAMEVASDKLLKRPFIYMYRKMKYVHSIKSAVKAVDDALDLSKFDLIHTNSARNDFGGVLYKKYDIPHIVHIREFGDADFNCWCYRKKYTGFLNETTTLFVAISEAVKKYWQGKGLAEGKVHVIYNGVDEKRIIPKDELEYSISEKLKLVIVGGVCEAKGQLQIIEAVAKLPEEYIHNVCIDIIGWGDKKYIDKIKRTAQENGIGEQVHFLGTRNDVPSILKNYDVGLMCSRNEGFGRVTVEYMHAGLAVIASNTGANEEIIQDEETGLLYEYGNIELLSRCILRLHTDRDLLKKCAVNGKKHAKRLFTKEINATNILEFYKHICKLG